MKKEYLKDVTFLVIAKFDSIERLENTLHAVHYLDKYFDTNVKLWEYASWNNGIVKHLLPKGVDYEYHEDLDPVFYRTHFLNNMIETVTTEFVSVWDVDVVIDRKQIIEAVKKLRKGTDIVYPYKVFYDTTDELRRIYFQQDCDLNVLFHHINYMIELYGPIPVGGAYLARTERYKESGKENEKFYGWGYEDGERYYRWINLGYKIERIEGPLFHLSHPRGINSIVANSDLDILKKRELIYTIKNKNGNEFD